MVAAFQVFAAQASINLGAAMAKGLFVALDPAQVAALRTVISALLLLVVVRPWRAPVSAASLGWIAAYGLALGGMNLLIYEALARIPIGLAVAIEICGPLMVVLCASRHWRDLVWLAGAVGGLALLLPWPGRAQALDPLGIGCALGAASCWALYILLGRRASRAGAGAAVSIGMIFACLLTAPVALAQGPLSLSAVQGGLLLLVAVLSSALPYLLEMHAMSRLPSRLVGLISSTGPALAALIGFVVLGERLTGLQWLAVALLVGASLGCSLQVKAPVSKLREEPLV